MKSTTKNHVFEIKVNSSNKKQILSEINETRLTNEFLRDCEAVAIKLRKDKNMEKITDNSVYWAKVKENAIIPTKFDENAGYDIYACFEDDYICIKPHSTYLIPTGIASAVGDDYYLQVQERGSTGSKGIKYGAGVIDSGYRGEIFIPLTNTNDIPVYIAKESAEFDIYPYKGCIQYPYKKAIAQLIIHHVPKMNSKEITYSDLLSIPSDRGTGALGSSGK